MCIRSILTLRIIDQASPFLNISLNIIFKNEAYLSARSKNCSGTGIIWRGGLTKKNIALLVHALNLFCSVRKSREGESNSSVNKK